MKPALFSSIGHERFYASRLWDGDARLACESLLQNTDVLGLDAQLEQGSVPAGLDSLIGRAWCVAIRGGDETESSVLLQPCRDGRWEVWVLGELEHTDLGYIHGSKCTRSSAITVLLEAQGHLATGVFPSPSAVTLIRRDYYLADTPPGGWASAAEDELEMSEDLPF